MGLTNQFEPSMVFDPSVFEGPGDDFMYFKFVKRNMFIYVINDRDLSCISQHAIYFLKVKSMIKIHR